MYTKNIYTQARPNKMLCKKCNKETKGNYTLCWSCREKCPCKQCGGKTEGKYTLCFDCREKCPKCPGECGNIITDPNFKVCFKCKDIAYIITCNECDHIFEGKIYTQKCPICTEYNGDYQSWADKKHYNSVTKILKKCDPKTLSMLAIISVPKNLKKLFDKLQVSIVSNEGYKHIPKYSKVLITKFVNDYYRVIENPDQKDRKSVV